MTADSMSGASTRLDPGGLEDGDTVGPPASGDVDLLAGEALEGRLPHRRGVLGAEGVERHDERAAGRDGHVDGLGPAGRVLEHEQARLVLADLIRRIAAVDVGHGADALRRRGHVDAEGVGRSEGEGSAHRTGAAGHGDLDARAGAVVLDGPAVTVGHDLPVGLGTRATAARAAPRRVGEVLHGAARGADERVVAPVEPAADADAARRRLEGPGDERVVDVDDGDAVGGQRRRRATPVLEGALERHAAGVLPRRVEHDDRLGAGAAGDRTEIDLVALDRGQPARAVGRHRGDDAVGHVGARRVRDDRATGRQRRRDERGDRALAVGARDHDGAPVAGHGAQHLRVDAQGEASADHRARAAAERLRQPAGRPPGGQRGAGTERIAWVSQSGYPSGRLGLAGRIPIDATGSGSATARGHARS